jgi:DMSO/TMAO reductase YedYZ molybdopterin-dependent catalytic subunit
MVKLKREFSRRNLLLGALQGAGLLWLTGCEKAFNALSSNDKVNALLASAESGNRRVQRFLAARGKLAQEFSEKDISPKFRSNGNPPPITIDYASDAANQFSAWKLEVRGLVNQPASFTLADLKTLPSRTQITRHDCVEGWSAIAKWKGVRLEEIVKKVQPSAGAKYIVFRCLDADSDGSNYYESIDLVDAVHPQTILAYEMNDRPLPVANGAPLRLRVENQLGYKHAKYIQSLEFVASFEKLAQGKGGYWEDQGYEWYAGI